MTNTLLALVVILLLVCNWQLYRLWQLAIEREKQEIKRIAPIERKENRLQILKDGRHHHWCKVGSKDHQQAIDTPGLYVKWPDGKVEEGIQ